MFQGSGIFHSFCLTLFKQFDIIATYQLTEVKKMSEKDNEIKLKKRKLTGGEKTTITIACILFVLIIISFFGTNILNAVSNRSADAAMSSKLVNNLFYELMPKEAEGAVTFGEDRENPTPVTFYVEKNPDFDYDNDEGIDYFNFYYYDEQGNKVCTTEDGTFESGANETKFEVLFGFTLKTAEKVGKIIDVFKIVRIILVILFFIDLIVLWFIEFSISEDAKKAKAYGKKPKKKKK